MYTIRFGHWPSRAVALSPQRQPGFPAIIFSGRAIEFKHAAFPSKLRGFRDPAAKRSQRSRNSLFLLADERVFPGPLREKWSRRRLRDLVY